MQSPCFGIISTFYKINITRIAVNIPFCPSHMQSAHVSTPMIIMTLPMHGTVSHRRLFLSFHLSTTLRISSLLVGRRSAQTLPIRSLHLRTHLPHQILVPTVNVISPLQATKTSITLIFCGIFLFSGYYDDEFLNS